LWLQFIFRRCEQFRLRFGTGTALTVFFLLRRNDTGSSPRSGAIVVIAGIILPAAAHRRKIHRHSRTNDQAGVGRRYRIVQIVQRQRTSFSGIGRQRFAMAAKAASR
jgi:hypothetical protein